MAVEALEAVAAHLGPVVPAPGPEAGVDELARVAAEKLSAHVGCHEAWHPPAGSMDGVRDRCRAWLAVLSAAEARAVVGVLAAELGAPGPVEVAGPVGPEELGVSDECP